MSEVTLQQEGRRVYADDRGLHLSEGDYGFNPIDGYWYGRPPGMHMGSFEKHIVVEHNDDTITVSPSILVEYDDPVTGNLIVWHGYLERGIWRTTV